MLGETFKVINIVAKVKRTSALPETLPPEKFDINNEKDIRRYLSEWLPSQMGIYLARLRKLEMTNDFSHAQQWSLVATEFDSQSFHGRHFGEVCSEDDYKRAMQSSLGAIHELFVDRPLCYVGRWYMSLVTEAKANLIKEYVKEMNFKVEDLKYDFFVNNCHGDGQEERVAFISPSEWNVIRKKIDGNFVPNKVETMRNWQVYIELQKKIRLKQIARYVDDIKNTVVVLGQSIGSGRK